MNLKIFALILASVGLSALAQIAFKLGMSSSVVQTAIGERAEWPLVLWQICTQPYVIGGFICYGIGALMWLFVLARIDVTLAYPFVGIGFILTMVLGVIVLGEVVSVMRIVGTLLIILGIALLASS